LNFLFNIYFILNISYLCNIYFISGAHCFLNLSISASRQPELYRGRAALQPEESSEGSSNSEDQSEYYQMDSRIRMPAYDEETPSHTESSYDGRSYSGDGGSQDRFQWRDVDAIHEPNIVEAMRKFQGHQALQQIMYTSSKKKQHFKGREFKLDLSRENSVIFSKFPDLLRPKFLFNFPIFNFAVFRQ
jgi:hypothetical protein